MEGGIITVIRDDIFPFIGGYPFSCKVGVNMPVSIIKWLKREKVNPAILIPEYGRTFAKNDYLVEV